MIPVQFPEANMVLAREQDQYEPMAVYVFNDAEGRVACCFRLSDLELAEIVREGELADAALDPLDDHPSVDEEAEEEAPRVW